jgi:hypothetical protein
MKKIIIVLVMLACSLGTKAATFFELTELPFPRGIELGMKSGDFLQINTNAEPFSMFEKTDPANLMYFQTNVAVFRQAVYQFEGDKLVCISLLFDGGDINTFFSETTNNISNIFGKSQIQEKVILDGKPPQPLTTQVFTWKHGNESACAYKGGNSVSITIFEPNKFNSEKLFVSEKMAARLKKIQDQINANTKRK